MRLLPIAVAALLYFTTLASAASAVLGIDLGTEYIKAALVKPGVPLEIVLSKDSKRKEVSALAFKPPKGDIAVGSYPERSYGSDALALAARFPGDVYPNLKQLLGVPADSNAAKEYARRYPALALESSPRGLTAFKSGAFHQDELSWAVEELLAMELKNVKENAQSMAGKAHRVSSVVFAIPAYYTADERKAVEVAAELAGLNVLGMVSDGLAVGLHYATFRTFPSVTDGSKPEHHLVFDMGAGSTVATVLRMQGRTVKDTKRYNKTIQEVTVLGTGWDRSLGGDAMNMAIVDDMVSKFTESAKFKKLDKSESDVRSHGRAMARLFKDSEKVRQVLSANKQTSASFEDLFEETDLRYKLSRDDFEKLTTDFAARLDAPIAAALKAADLTFADLTSVILHGGATRTPFVSAKLESLVGDAAKLRTNVNADEAAVFGAAFKAAQISPSFRVKDIVAGDAASYATFLQYSLDGKGKTQKLFTPLSIVGVSKDLPFTQLDDFSFKLYQAKGAFDESGSAPATYTFTTKNLTASVSQLVEKSGCSRNNITNSFVVRLSPINGLPEVVKGSVSCVVEEAEKKSVVDGVKDMFGFGKKDQEPLKADDASSSSSSSSAPSSSSSSSASAKESKAAKKEKAPKKRTEIIPIEFTTTCEGCNDLPREELSRMKQRLAAFDAADKARKEREEDMNNLESFIYKVRSILEESDFTEYSSSTERTSLEKLVDAASEWMYEKEGQSATAAVLKAKLKEMTDIVNPVNRRQKEASLRPGAIKAFEKALEEATGFADFIKNGIAQAAASASSAAEEASKSASSVVSEVTSESSRDALDDLDEELPSQSKEPTPSATPNIADLFSQYKPEDLDDIQKLYDEAKEYLAGQVAKQAKLTPTDDPAFDSADLETKAKKLSTDVMKIIQRNMPKWDSNGGGSKSSKKEKTKTTTSKKDKKSSSSTSSSASKSASASVKDEL
jgi:hypoxia up-regulated 1